MDPAIGGSLAPERTFLANDHSSVRAEALVYERTPEVPILMYHSIADDGPPALARYRVTPENFNDQIRCLRERGFYSISLEELQDSIVAQRMLPGRPIIITFDDGYRNFRENAWPSLQRWGFTAVMFVVTDKVGDTADWDITGCAPLPLMDWDELRELRDLGLSIGSHTATHPDLLTLSTEQIVAEGRISRNTLSRELGCDIVTIAFPYGRTDEPVRSALADAGYRIAVGTFGGICTLTHELLNLPRIEIFNDDGLAAFAEKTTTGSIRASETRGRSSGRVPTIDLASSNSSTTQDEATGTKMALNSDYVHHLAARLDKLIGDFVLLQGEMLNALGRADSLSVRISQLFCLPITGTVQQNLAPYHELASGIYVGFQPGDEVRLEIQPKRNHSTSPIEYLNTIRLSFMGSSQFRSLEFACSWHDISSAQRFQLGLYAEVAEPISCRIVIRVQNKDGRNTDLQITELKICTEAPSSNRSGELRLPDLIDIDMNAAPRLLMFLESQSDIDLKLHYLNFYFA